MAPRVSLLVAMRNEEQYISACLHSIFAQDYPAESLEIIVADGQSTDRSRDIVEQLFAGRANCRLLHNPQRIQSAGWNLGIAAASGEVVGIVSAHAELASDYVSRAVETLRRTGADMVGGPMTAVGLTPVARAVAAATSSRFGVGGATFHYATVEQQVDTVYMGLCRRELYERLGGFDPELVRNQDDELSYRLLDAGGRIVCNPAIRSRYFNRSTLWGLARQYFQYGYWKVRVMHKHPKQMRMRHFAPMAAVGGAVGGLLLGLLFAPVAVLTAAAIATYAAGAVVASVANARGHDLRTVLLMPVVFAILHGCYGAGFWRGLLAFGPVPRQREAGSLT